MRPPASLFADRRGNVALLFAFALFTVVTTIGVAVDFSRLADGRAALQRAVDNAALSGASALAVDTTGYQCIAVNDAAAAFLNATQTLPAGFIVNALPGNSTVSTTTSIAGVPTTLTAQCNNPSGPGIAATDQYGYVTGTPGMTAAKCVPGTGPYVSGTTVNCAFIVTVNASATDTTSFAWLFGQNQTIKVTGVAANPFVNLSRAFSFPNGISGSAKYTNSIWVYPLLLDANGNPAFSAANPGALPDTTNCTNGAAGGTANGPDEAVCGSYVMLGSLQWGGTPTITVTDPSSGKAITFNYGVVQDPVSPNTITATTLLGVAFKSISSGPDSSVPHRNAYGYLTSNGSYTRAPDGCIYPSDLVYNTIQMPFQTTTVGSTTTVTPIYPWSFSTHWFYSSYLANNLPPSYGEIYAQTHPLTSPTMVSYSEDVPSVINDPSATGANIGGSATYFASPSPPVPILCPALTGTISNDEYVTTTYPTSGSDNGSLFIEKTATNTYVPPSSYYTTIYQNYFFNPASTPGQQYAAQSCQGYGNSVFTFYWNDMGGAQTDDTDYNNGSLQISCSGPTHVILIQ